MTWHAVRYAYQQSVGFRLQEQIRVQHEKRRSTAFVIQNKPGRSMPLQNNNSGRQDEVDALRD